MAQEIYHRSEWGNPTETWGNSYLNADLTNELYKRASEYENSWVTDQLLNGVGIKPSIILTPTAYEDGVLNSVKPAKTFGNELVPSIATIENNNGGIITQINGNSYSSTSDGTSSSSIRPKFDFATTSGKIYKLVITPIGTVTGTVNFDFYDGSTYLFQNYDFTSTKEITFTDNGGVFGAFDGTQTYSISNFTISIKEVIDADFDFTRGSSATRVNEQGLVEDVQILSGELVQNGDFEQIGSEQIVNGSFDTDSDWTKGTGWSISGGKAISDGTIGSYNLTQGGAVTVGKIYKITITVSDYVSGNVEVSAGASPRGTMTANGTYTFYQKATPANSFYIISNSFLGSIDNVSVKEVGQNWELTDGAFFTSNGINITNSPVAGGLTSDGYTALVVGRKYRMTYEIIENNAGLIKLVSAIDETMVSTVGTHTKEFIADQSDIIIFRSGSTVDVTINNISVVEVTDDTDLPRINYTNFDYEDVLGDELVTNGTFDTDSDWTKGASWSISDGKASSDGTSNNSFSQNGILTIGKTYKLTLDLTHTSGTLLLLGAYYETQVQFTASDSYTVYIVPKQNNLTFYASSFVGSIDNVSLKEFTEDVVVPYSGEGSLLLENQSTNLYTDSNNFLSWSVGGSLTLTPNYTISPSGENNATRLQWGSGTNFLYKSLSHVGNNFTNSFYIKSNTSENQYLKLFLDNGAQSQEKTITPQWQRFTLTNVATPTQSNRNAGLIRSSNQVGDLDVSIAFSQFEALSYATSYIPTNGSTVTRLADVCNNSGNSDLINSTEGVLYAEISALANDGTNRAIAISDGTTSNVVRFYYSVTDNRIVGNVKSVGTTVFNYNNVLTDATDFLKIAVSYKANDFKMYVNGTEVSTDTSGNVPIGLNELAFDNGAGNDDFYGNVKCVAVFKEALSDEELQKLTTI